IALLVVSCLALTAGRAPAQLGIGRVRIIVDAGAANHDNSITLGEVSFSGLVLDKFEVFAGLGYYTFDRLDLDSPVAHLGGVYHFSSLLPWRSGIGLQLGRSLGADTKASGSTVAVNYNILDLFYNLDLRIGRVASLTGRLGVQKLSGDLDDSALAARLGLSVFIR
ncbi:MAG: hypothetical protein V1794_19310, partial [Candidatus Glassbacteria bacterium]